MYRYNTLNSLNTGRNHVKCGKGGEVRGPARSMISERVSKTWSSTKFLGITLHLAIDHYFGSQFCGEVLPWRLFPYWTICEIQTNLREVSAYLQRASQKIWLWVPEKLLPRSLTGDTASLLLLQSYLCQSPKIGYASFLHVHLKILAQEVKTLTF